MGEETRRHYGLFTIGLLDKERASPAKPRTRGKILLHEPHGYSTAPEIKPIKTDVTDAMNMALPAKSIRPSECIQLGDFFYATRRNGITTAHVRTQTGRLIQNTHRQVVPDEGTADDGPHEASDSACPEHATKLRAALTQSEEIAVNQVN
ncbi:hypothetical protein DL766_000922 [Monosporascus sp. MC13-8B]|uniref:Uncharacterized protein n=1 Tax=Monosporascus cannonballus TaxID=155416 RepID=A0ABY0HB10_9PEZI|nr:hypothetical protein DL762_003308 [Monosporascus cannonballus]RYP00748.1 hypothetical protein DL763_000628 [Monosporascus cannonballus]RYP38505.1 hypothetical protein DL766_000922 [Monosporascus sp. MC13-8B]